MLQGLTSQKGLYGISPSRNAHQPSDARFTASLWYTEEGEHMLLCDSSTLACWCLDVCFQEEKEMMMANWLEDLTHMVSDDTLPRREALRRMVGVVAGATLAA